MGLLYAMANANRVMRFSSTVTLPVIINGNGSYAGAPVRDEDTRYPMDNLLLPDRGTPWSTKVGNADGGMPLRLDFGGGAQGAGAGGTDKTFNAFGIFALRAHGGSIPPTNITIRGRTRAQGYTSAAWDTITAYNTGQARDSIVMNPSGSWAYKYIEVSFDFYDVSGFSCKVFAGTISDLGIGWSSEGGAEWEVDHNVLRSRMAGGHSRGVKRGDSFERRTLAFRSIDNAKRSTLNVSFGSTFFTTMPFTMLDENDVVRQYMVMDGPRFRQRWNGLYDAEIALEQLG